MTQWLGHTLASFYFQIYFGQNLLLVVPVDGFAIALVSHIS